MSKIIPLRKKEDFERLFKIGRSRKGRFFLLKFAKSENNETRASIIVSKKISKLAVVRNRCKRKMREAFRLTDFRKGFDYVLVVLVDISRVDQREVEGDVKRVFC